MNYLSLFSGIGGMDLGLDRAGMTCVGQVEIDPFCRRVLARHWPEAPRHDDVRTAVDWWLGVPRPAVDVVCGGFPCQPVSLAGRGLAQADERWLWPAAWAVIRDLRPRFAILENVPGLLGRGLGDVLGDLAEIGYDAEWDCVPAAAVGAPHRRDRVFVVAYPDGDQHEVDSHALGRTSTEDVLANANRAPEQQARNAFGVNSAAQVLRRGTAEPRGRGLDVADPDRERQLQPSRVFGQERRRPRDCGWWTPEPAIRRVAHGIPRRMERLRALGNAVVPQVAEHVGRLVMAGAA